MAKYSWKGVTRENVLEAIRIFMEDNPQFPMPRNTYLIYDGKKLPAKHIRGMAYKVAYGENIEKSEYTGGKETVDFFERLGFETLYFGKGDRTDHIITEENDKSSVLNDTDNIKIGLYLQTETAYNEISFNKAMEAAKNAEFDILVFPETCYFPKVNDKELFDILNCEDRDDMDEYVLNLSRKIKKAVVLNTEDSFGTIYSIYGNEAAATGETLTGIYIKHTMTESSAFDLSDYRENGKYLFDPILYKGKKIGLTICYDCNHAAFSRMWGKQGVDIILNSTGGDVVFDKWYKYNKARAIENHCYNFVTMGGSGNKSNPHSYVYGFNRNGKELPFHNIMENTKENNKVNTIYVYDTADDDGEASVESSIGQKETLNKNSQYNIPVGEIDEILLAAKKIKEGLYIKKVKNFNIVFCVVKGKDILCPEKTLSLLYDEKLKKIPNKKYVIVSQFDHLEQEFYETKLSIVLKVRTMENFCVVILESDTENHCYQCGYSRTVQLVKPDNGKYMLDLNRAGGPESIWKDKLGMRADWRKNFEWLIKQL